MIQIVNFKAVFFDFDGVIKDSVEVKSEAFYDLFLPFGEQLASRVRKHHEDNGGMSRYDKLPIYLKWANQAIGKTTIKEYAAKFSRMVTQCVIDSPWVCGVLDFLQSNQEKNFYLVSATPQNEIEIILKSLEIEVFFDEIVGSPTSKTIAIHNILNAHKLQTMECIMIGDSISDYQAATENKIQFILRKTPLNYDVQVKLNCIMIDDFEDMVEIGR